MALSYPIGRRYQITTADHGKFPTLGNVSETDAGVWRLSFVPDESFAGSIGIVGRAAGKDAHDDEVGFASVPYRLVQQNGLAVTDASLRSGVLTGDFIVEVPANGLSVALLVECTAGTGYLYSQALVTA